MSFFYIQIWHCRSVRMPYLNVLGDCQKCHTIIINLYLGMC